MQLQVKVDKQPNGAWLRQLVALGRDLKRRGYTSNTAKVEFKSAMPTTFGDVWLRYNVTFHGDVYILIPKDEWSLEFVGTPANPEVH